MYTKVYLDNFLFFLLLLTEKATSVQMKPMPKPTRILLHTLAKYYNVNSYEYDPEPNRYVSFVKLLDSRVPNNILSARCTAKYFYRGFTLLQSPNLDVDFPFALSFCRRTLEPGEDPSANLNYGSGPSQDPRGAGHRVENIPTLTSTSELLLRIQLCNGNQRLTDSKLDSSYCNALIIHLKNEEEAVKVLDVCLNDRAITLRYDVEHRGWARQGARGRWRGRTNHSRRNQP